MIKTAKEIQSDIVRLLKGSTLCSELSGKVYNAGMRPRDSQKEDVVVTFTGGFTEQIQTGIVTIHIYIPDVDPYENGVFVEDGERTEALERMVAEWVESLTADKSSYKIELQQTITTQEAYDIKQHFVVVKLKYRYLD